jgi:predicted phosphodiesterase
MRIGVISDVHGNLPALEAVLARLEEESIDRYVCLGDIAVGPWASECVKRLRALGPDLVLGNWDAWMLDGIPPCPDTVTGRMLLEMGTFWANQLDDADLEYMRTATLDLHIDAPDGPKGIIAFHGSPRSYNEAILASSATEEVTHMLATYRAALVLVGHTHIQMSRRLPFTVVVNPGSVGLPFYEWPVAAARVCPWAEYGVVDFESEDSVQIELCRAPYDVNAVVEYALSSGVPHAVWWTACWDVLSEPTASAPR